MLRAMMRACLVQRPAAAQSGFTRVLVPVVVEPLGEPSSLIAELTGPISFLTGFEATTKRPFQFKHQYGYDSASSRLHPGRDMGLSVGAKECS
jgi:hypothetical protein